MKSMKGHCPKWTNRSLGLLLIRIVLGTLLIYHGWSKLADMSGTISFFASLGFASFWAYIVALVETLGGLAILLGVFLCPATFAVAIEFLVIIIALKWRPGFLGGHEMDFLMLFVVVGLGLAGAGKYSVMHLCCHCSGDSKCSTCNGSSTCAVEKPTDTQKTV